jgi:DNA glycosylase AlkZ-like
VFRNVTRFEWAVGYAASLLVFAKDGSAGRARFGSDLDALGRERVSSVCVVIALSWDQVLAFRVERQFLTEPARRGGLLSVVSALCGLHGQELASAELAAWARVKSLRKDAVKRALEEERTLVKTWTVRDTLHLVPADDLPMYVAVLRPRPEGPSAGWLHQRRITREQYQAIVENVPRALDGRPRSREWLADRLVELAGPDVREPALESWGGSLKMSARMGDLCFGPSRGRNITFVRPDRWLRRPLPTADPEEARRELVRRLLGAYGVASYDDMYRWLENSRIAKELVHASRDELVEVQVDGRAAWAHQRDLDELVVRRRARGVHLLPAFDPYLVGPRPREAFVPAERIPQVFRSQGRVAPVLLVDGRAAGVWSHELRDSRLGVEVATFEELRRNTRKAVQDEVDRLAAFLGGSPELSITA